MGKPPLISLGEPLLAACDPSATAFLDWLRPRVDDVLLETIAEADYGTERTAHLEALRRIRDENAVFAPMPWVPGEVLSLAHWSEPDAVTPKTKSPKRWPAWTPSWKEPSGNARGHLSRAFCCAVLLRAAVEPANAGLIAFSGENQTVIQLVASALVLERDATVAALRFLCWRAQTLLDEEDYPFLALGILLLAVRLYHDDADGPWLRQLADWVLAVEAIVRVRKRLPSAPRWLIGLAYDDDPHLETWPQTWRAVAWSVLVEPPALPPAAAAGVLHEIAERLF